jgi:GT2 family glycosyltransferase
MSSRFLMDAGLLGERPHSFAPRVRPQERTEARGKFVFLGESKFYVRGVTYGTFATDAAGREHWCPNTVAKDLQAIAENGFNALRVYTVPPDWLLDLALEHGLKVMVGLPWEQHINFLDSSNTRQRIESKVRAGVNACAGHPAILCFAVGNEIPAAVVRWYGQRAVERFLDRLALAARKEDPRALVTYVNFPSTEYLKVASADLVAFNVFLESRTPFEAYLARLQNLAEGRPLLMAEIGLDSRRHGAEAQADRLNWQVRAAMAAGCAGAFVFAWTDEWHRGGREIEDWGFGLTTSGREPKPALSAVREAFADAPFPKRVHWPRVSVVICTRNGGRTLEECLQGIESLEYPNYEIIVVDDGSTDNSALIASSHDCRLISTPNRGLSSARNTGWQAATGEIIAYIDDDAYPDRHWLNYLVQAFQKSSHAAIGGPNLPPPCDRLVPQCIADAPGSPTHVLLTDDLAEHIPGCNMAFRRKVLAELAGFDPQFRIAGDDVDICWRVQERGWTVGFSPAAMVWHHRRSTIPAYWRQQKGYGKAEALLERKWPNKYNAAGHVTWSGRVYDRGISELFARSRIYHGVWGSALFQRLYQQEMTSFLSLACMPEWWLVICGLVALTGLGLFWRPLLWFGALAVLASGLFAAQVVSSARKSTQASVHGTSRGRFLRFWIAAGLNLLQPLARLLGRIPCGLTAWRRHGPRRLVWPRRWELTVWSEGWRCPTQWLREVEDLLGNSRSVVLKGGAFDRWDLELRGGLLGGARCRLLVEEHGNGRQLLRFRAWPRFRILGLIPLCVFAYLTAIAGYENALVAAVILGAVSVCIVGRSSSEWGSAQAALKSGLVRLREGLEKPAGERLGGAR